MIWSEGAICANLGNLSNSRRSALVQRSETGNGGGGARGAWLSEIANKGDLVRGSGPGSIQNNGTSRQSALVQQMKTGNCKTRERSALNSDTTTQVSSHSAGAAARNEQLAARERKAFGSVNCREA